MTGVIATLPKFQFSNALGLPMSGGTLTSYLAGTTTPATTYQDQALSTANANPISLDSRGECTLWLDSTKTYKFVLKNAAGVIQWTVDNITNAADFADQLRTDLAAPTGSSLVGYTPDGVGVGARTVENKLRESVSVLDFYANGASGALVDPTGALRSDQGIQAAINYATTNDKALVIPSGSYLIQATVVTSGTLDITANDAFFLKNFDGVGLRFQNGAGDVYLYGKLTVKGHGAFAGTGLIASTSPNATGIEFSNSRVRVMGVLISSYHIGDAIRFIATAPNANKSHFNELRGIYSNGRGIYCSGTDNQQSVWGINWFTQYNYAGGVFITDTYMGRQWTGNIYNEASCQDGVSIGVYLGQLLACDIAIYSEEQSSTGLELVIGANCRNLRIVDQRSNETDNLSPATCIVESGGMQYAHGGVTKLGSVFGVNLNTISETMTKEFLGAGGVVIAKQVIRGDGAIEHWGQQFGTSVTHGQGIAYNRIDNYAFGSPLVSWFSTANGTQAVPTTKVVAENAYQQLHLVYTGAAYHTPVEISYPITAVGSGNKSSCDILYKLTPVGASTRVDSFKYQSDGDLELLVAGKGLIVKSPDGLITKRIGIDNTGALVLTAP